MGFAAQQFIENDDLVIRTHDLDKIEHLKQMAADEGIHQYFDSIALCPHNEDKASRLSRRIQEQRAGKRDDFNAAIEVDGEIAGDMMLLEIREGHQAEIAYWIGREFWGRGIVKEAVRLFTEFAFKEYNLKRIYAYVRVENKASAAVLKANGFELEGVTRKSFELDGEFFDEEIYAIVRN